MNISSGIYLNTAAFGVIDLQAKAKADAFYEELALGGSGVSERWRAEDEPRIRQTLAAFIGAKPEQTAMVSNFSGAFNALVQSLRGDERVLLYRDDFPSLLEPFRMNKFDIHWIGAAGDFALPLDEIKDLVENQKVDVLAISHVQYNSGYCIPLAEIAPLCREHGVKLLVDATQSIGALPVDLGRTPVDALVASNYKWMNAGFGNGIFYASESFLKEYPPVIGGANSFAFYGDQWKHVPSARSYEPGHPNMYGLTLLGAAVENRMAAGVHKIAEHNLALTSLFLDGINGLELPLIGPESMDRRCSIVLFRDEDGLGRHIRESGFTITHRGYRLRISFHYYNDTSEVVRLIDCLKGFRRP